MTARSNGLRASAYAILLEIEESLGDAMLTALAARDIAAYVEPVAGPGGTTRLTLYVDVLQRAPAGVVLAGLTPAMAGDPPADGEPPQGGTAAETPVRQLADETAGQRAGQSDDDAAFAALVEAFHRSPGERTWPDAEDLPSATPPVPPPVQPGSAPRTALPADTVLPAIPPVPPRRAARKWDPNADNDRRRPASSQPSPGPVEGFDSFETAADDEEHYIPPPLPRLEPSPFATRWALFGLLIGLALLLVPTFLDFGHRTSLDIAGVVFVLGSGAFLVMRLRDRSPDDPDDGAVV